MSKIFLFLALFALSFTFAQEGAIKFQATLDSNGMPVAQPPKPETPQKLGIASNRPLNLAELSAKDTASFDTYSRRRALVEDSISAMQIEIENSKKRSLLAMPDLTPKDEYEKQSEYDARKAKWERELGERTMRDYKPFADRLSELEKAKKKIEDNQAALYCTIEIKTSPDAASIYLNKDEIGASPAEYKLALPGYSVLKIQKEGYEPWDTTLTLQPAQKLKLNITLQEKSIFSKENEIDFPKILAKDTTVDGYRERMNKVNARIAQIDDELKILLNDFSDTYPALEPQKPDETPHEFERRKAVWHSEGERRVGILQSKHEKYKNKLIRTFKALEDNIIATESQFITETRPNANITLGTYDVEREVFEIEVQDMANAQSPFHFVGKVGVPRDTAKAMNRSTDGFLAGVSYLNYPFVSGDSSFNLAMKDMSISRKAVPLKVDGAFKPLDRFESMEGYGTWRSHADSLLSGSLKSQDLDLDYVLKEEKKKKEAAGSWGGLGLSLSQRTMILAFTATAAFGAAAVAKHLKVGKYENDINKTNKNMPSQKDPGYGDWWNEWSAKKDKLDDSMFWRAVYGACAGVSAVGGILTFVF